MDWIMSEGGPLLCVERRLQHLWGGVDRLTVTHSDAPSDYERACESKNYVLVVPMTTSTALAFGGGPMDTSFQNLLSGKLCLIQILYMEHNAILAEKLVKLDESIFLKPLEISEWQADTSSLVLFDSAFPGNEKEKDSLSFELRHGRYRVCTQHFEPDTETFLVLHRFDPID